MVASEQIIAEFTDLHRQYREASRKIEVLQAMAVEGIRKVGVGCLTEESRTEFIALQEEINRILARMREICEALH